MPYSTPLTASAGSTRCRLANAWFADHFGVALPRGLRDLADEMSWESFVAAYGHTAGPLRLGHWACTDTERPGPQARNFRAMIAVGDRISTSTAAASGPIAALTAMLYERGITVEMLSFHQMESERIHRDFHSRHRRRPRRVGNGLVEGPHRVRAARDDRLRQPIVRRAQGCVAACQSGRSTIGMPSIGIGMPL